jgi:hypothetical protein
MWSAWACCERSGPPVRRSVLDQGPRTGPYQPVLACKTHCRSHNAVVTEVTVRKKDDLNWAARLNSELVATSITDLGAQRAEVLALVAHGACGPRGALWSTCQPEIPNLGARWTCLYIRGSISVVHAVPVVHARETGCQSKGGSAYIRGLNECGPRGACGPRAATGIRRRNRYALLTVWTTWTNGQPQENPRFWDPSWQIWTAWTTGFWDRNR